MHVCARMCRCVQTGSGYAVASNLGSYDYGGDGKIVQSLVGGENERKAEKEGGCTAEREERIENGREDVTGREN